MPPNVTRVMPIEEARRRIKKVERRSFATTFLCILCTVVTVLVVAPTVIDTSNSVNEQDRVNAIQDQVNVQQDRVNIQIQNSRREGVILTCNEQNEINKETIKTLNKVLKKAKKGASPERLAEIKASRVSTILLINALAPVKNCEKRADKLVGPIVIPASQSPKATDTP